MPNIIVVLGTPALGDGAVGATAAAPAKGEAPNTIVWLAARDDGAGGAGAGAAVAPAAPNIMVVLGAPPGGAAAAIGVGSEPAPPGLAVKTLPHLVH